MKDFRKIFENVDIMNEILKTAKQAEENNQKNGMNQLFF